jgi:hypothetical protein
LKQSHGGPKIEWIERAEKEEKIVIPSFSRPSLFPLYSFLLFLASASSTDNIEESEIMRRKQLV